MMPDDLESIFEEVVSTEPEIEVDNPDDGADVNDTELDFEDVEDIEDSDTDPDGPPDAADVEDDFDWNEILQKYGDRPVQLTVNGEIVEKPLKELPSMAMMREDYSRKTADAAADKRAAQWAQDVIENLQTDPVKTLQAFAEAYGVPTSAIAPATQAPAVDPYEDVDPDIAVILRKMDEQEKRHQAELEAVRRQAESLTDKQIRAEVQAEYEAVKAFYGDDLDEVEMLGVAQQYHMTLSEAAEFVVGRKLLAQSKVSAEAETKASQAAREMAEGQRKSSKRRAASAATPAFNAGSDNLDGQDFTSISELYELVASSSS